MRDVVTTSGPGGFERELVLARWPDGGMITRWIGKPKSTRTHNTFYIRMIPGPGKAITSWFAVCTLEAFPQVSFINNIPDWNGSPKSIPNADRWTWFFQAAVAPSELKRRLEKSLFRTGVDSRLVSEPGELVNEVELYALLSELHPAFLPDPEYFAWLGRDS